MSNTCRQLVAAQFCRYQCEMDILIGSLNVQFCCWLLIWSPETGMYFVFCLLWRILSIACSLFQYIATYVLQTMSCPNELIWLKYPLCPQWQYHAVLHLSLNHPVRLQHCLNIWIGITKTAVINLSFYELSRERGWADGVSLVSWIYIGVCFIWTIALVEHSYMHIQQCAFSHIIDHDLMILHHNWQSNANRNQSGINLTYDHVKPYAKQ